MAAAWADADGPLPTPASWAVRAARVRRMAARSFAVRLSRKARATALASAAAATALVSVAVTVITSASVAAVLLSLLRSEAPVSPGSLRAAASSTSGVVRSATFVASRRGSVSVPVVVVVVVSETIRAVAR